MRAFAGQPHYFVARISSIVHEAPMLPSPTWWSPKRRGEEEVSRLWWHNPDLLWHA